MTLNRLAQPQIERMIERITDEKRLPPEVRQLIVQRTDGVPLFVEEMTKAILESDYLKDVDGHYALTGSFSTFAIPATLHDSLMARLDRLVTAKAVAQYAAVIGRQFAYDLLSMVSQLDAATLQRELGRLVEAEIVYQRGVPPQSTYVFKHALIQDTAYESLLKSTRQQYHQRIAQVLEAHFPESGEMQPELLAHHYTEAGLTEQAIGYWQRAGERAVQHSANVEAIGHLTKGITLLKQLEETTERLQQELACQTALGTALMVTRGYAAPEVEQTYSRAQELCQQGGEAPQLFSALWGVWYFYAVRPDVPKAIELATQLFTLAHRVHDSTLLMIAHRALGSNLIVQGKLLQGLEQMRHGSALYHPQQHRALAFVYGQDIGVICQQWSAWALWLLGYPDQALQMTRETLQRAQEVVHPLTLAYATTFSAIFHQFRRETARAKELAESALRLATDQGFDVFLALAQTVLGEVVEHGEIEEGIIRTREGIAAFQATGAELFLPFHLTQLAEAHGKVEQVDAGLAALDEALAIVDRGGEHTWDADLYRVKGELMLLQGAGEPDVEACFYAALEVAQRQGAKSYELRATMSLTRLWQQQGKRAEAHELLAPVYGWFTEGFDTLDLQEAKALLDALA
jgi:predicted ATPase